MIAIRSAWAKTAVKKTRGPKLSCKIIASRNKNKRNSRLHSQITIANIGSTRQGPSDSTWPFTRHSGISSPVHEASQTRATYFLQANAQICAFFMTIPLIWYHLHEHSSHLVNHAGNFRTHCTDDKRSCMILQTCQLHLWASENHHSPVMSTCRVCKQNH